MTWTAIARREHNRDALRFPSDLTNRGWALIGNEAVQEVNAARTHYDADFAVVVCTSGYTKSVKQLANTNGVLLLDASNIADIEVLLGIAS